MWALDDFTGISGANRLALVASDSSFGSASSKSITWDKTSGNVDTYFDTGTPLTVDADVANVSEIEWHGVKIAATTYNTCEWSWLYT